MAIIDWLVVLGYFCILAIVVFATKRKQETGEDFFLGGRNVGWLAIGASIFAANIGSEHLIGLAGSGALNGLSLSHLEFHAWIIIMMSWVFLPFYYKSGVSTMPEFLERRYGERARWILSLVSLAAYVLTKISVTVFAGALFFEVMMPEVQLTIGNTVISSFWIGAIATVTLAGIYSSFGGLTAVVYTDLVQTGIILVGTLSVTAFALYYLGNSGVALADGSTSASIADGWQVLKETIKSTGNTEQFALWHSLTHKVFPWLGVAVASVTIGVWYWCTDQFIIQRTLSAKNLTHARRGAIWGALLKLAPVFLFLVPGMLGFALHHNQVKVGDGVFAIQKKTIELNVKDGKVFEEIVDGKSVKVVYGIDNAHKLKRYEIVEKDACKEGTAKALKAYIEKGEDGTVKYFSMDIDGDKVFPTLVQSLLPKGFRGLVVAGMIAALMSSLASLFNSVSTLFTVDVYQKLKPEATPQKLVKVGRATTIAMTILGIVWVPIMKAISGGGLYQYIQAVQSFLAPPIVAVFALGIFWKRVNLRGACWGLGLGFTLGMAKLTANAIWGGAQGFALIQDYYFSGILLGISILIVVIASFTAPAPSMEKLNGLNFQCLDEKYRKENRESWCWIDVLCSTIVISFVVWAYIYFWTWLD
ncbi:MAG: sodium:solute symporter [Kiritimatiellae bacterium]|nr:sodium:solute symporter [Kiritimatiellia bacterium]